MTILSASLTRRIRALVSKAELQEKETAARTVPEMDRLKLLLLPAFISQPKNKPVDARGRYRQVRGALEGSVPCGMGIRS